MKSDVFCSQDQLLERIKSIYPARSVYLLAALEDAQSGLGYVPEDVIEPMGAYFDIPGEMVCSLIEDCEALQMSPPAKHALHVCQGPICAASGGSDLIGKAREAIGTCEGVQLIAGHCLGLCHDAPVARLDGSTMCRAKPDDVIRQLRLLNPDYS